VTERWVVTPASAEPIATDGPAPAAAPATPRAPHFERMASPLALNDAVVARLAGAPLLARAAMVARLQRAAGNAAVARRLSVSATSLAREEGDGAPQALDVQPGDGDAIKLQQAGQVGKAQAPPAPVAKRPPLTTTTKNCDDCKAAAAILNSGVYVGEASVQATWAGVGDIKATKTKQGWSASVGIAWSIDAATSTIEVTDFVWPNMTDADKAAVAAFRSALLAHEEGHFTAVEAAIAKLPKTVTATGATEAAAVAAVQDKVPTQVAAGQKAIDAATASYDARTKNGRTQSIVGGTNVTLTCPPSPAAPAPKKL